MKAQHSMTKIASLIGHHMSTISRELRRNACSCGHHPKKLSELEIERSEQSRSACTLAPRVKESARALLQCSPEQVARRLPVSQETISQYAYAYKTQGGKLWKNLRCQNQKRKRYAIWRDRQEQIPNRRHLGKRVGHWECDTFICANCHFALRT